MTATATATPIVERTFGPVRPPHIAVFALILVVAYAIGPSVFLSSCVAVALWATATSPTERALALVLPIGFRLALALGDPGG